MRRIHLLAKRAAVSNINVLIVGETGVGKEVLAESSTPVPARAEALLRINCAALRDAVRERAVRARARRVHRRAAAKPGLFEAAKGGTVFLDEIGELPLALQAKLLRVLETQEVHARRRACEPRTVDVRFVAATNRDLEARSRAGAFRAGPLLPPERLHVVVPPLRERVDEIEPLARSFVETAAKVAERPVPKIAPRR